MPNGGGGGEMSVAEGKLPKADRRGGSGMMSGRVWARLATTHLLTQFLLVLPIYSS